MRMLPFILLTLLVWLSPAEAAKTAAVLREKCEQSYDFCTGFIDGVLSENEHRQRLKGRLCLPEPVTYSQLFEAYVGYYDADPQRLANRPAAAVVVDALVAEYACRN